MAYQWAVIDITSYDAAQAVRVPRAASGMQHTYLLKGLSRCAQCGGLLWSTTHGRARISYYRQQGGTRECPVGERVVPCVDVDSQGANRDVVAA